MQQKDSSHWTDKHSKLQSAQLWVLSRAAGCWDLQRKSRPYGGDVKSGELPGKVVSKYWISFKRWPLMIWTFTLLSFSLKNGKY